MEEHESVRERAGMFDISHMGEIVVGGPQAVKTLQAVVTNDVSQLAVGRGLYTVMCLPNGGIVDDFTVFRIASERYLLIVNAATTPRDLSWIQTHSGGASVRDSSREMGLVALQGPNAGRILGRLTSAPFQDMRPFDAFPEVDLAGRRVFLSRTGYTGEDGFEIGPSWTDTPGIWEALLEAGAAEGLVPVGLGARDTLRLEAGFMLYGADIDETTSPLEAPLGWVVKWDKGDFIGRQALLRQREEGPPRKLVGFIVDGRVVARQGFALMHQGRRVGRVTSGTFSPTLQRSIGMGYVPRHQATAEAGMDVEVRGRAVPARIVRLPFYRARKQG